MYNGTMDNFLPEPTAISSPQVPQTYRSRVRTEPTNATAPQWSAALWARLETMFQEMADCCIKVRWVIINIGVRVDNSLGLCPRKSS
jgi:hypothetical protein